METATSDAAKVRVFVVARIRFYREGLISALGACGRVEIVGEADDCATALARAPALSPHVVIVDIETPDALRIIAALRIEGVRNIVIFAVGDDEAQLMAFAEAGATGYVTPDYSIEGLVEVIERVAQGELQCSSHVAAMLIRQLGTHASPHEREDLQVTGREWQVLSLIRNGLSNKEIGRALHISEATVKNHVHHLLGKLGVSTRTQAVGRFAAVAACREGLVTRRNGA